jgi:3-phytase
MGQARTVKRRSAARRAVPVTAALALALTTVACTGDTDDSAGAPPSTPSPGSTPAEAPGGLLATTAAPIAQTEPFPAGDGDIADDVAIWADPDDPARTVLLAGSKDDDGGGIAVYDVRGRLLQFRADGKIGNVDLRADVPLGGRDIVLVGANNRSDDTLALWELDPATRELTPLPGPAIATVEPNYGFCLYRSAASGRTYAFVTEEDGGTLQQLELTDDGGTFAAREVRVLDVGSQSEGCVADDEAGVLYVAEEDVGLWRYGAEPDAGDTRRPVDTTDGDVLSADVEGVALLTGPQGTGYLLVSSQGDSTFAVYGRSGDNPYLGSFSVVDGAGIDGAQNIGGAQDIDGAQDTDGLDVTGQHAGPGFEEGLLVVHDADPEDGDMSNLKLVPLEGLLSVPGG